ncbi:MAG: T9SS type A sorting domain-containing protein [Bacteroidetes bacterium]|nr:T9SS type A sorting domain-containing protein [Bacteroidota bacterium]
MKNFLIVLSFTVAGLVSAQSNLELTPNPASILGNSIDAAVIEVEIINNGLEPQDYLWRRTVNDIPAEWFSFVCDPNLCYGPNQDVPAMSFVITPENHKLKITFSPNGIPGTGYGEIEVHSTTDSANYNAIVSLTADLNATGFHSPNVDNTFTVYPNPANEIVNVMASFSADIHAIKILNIVGKEVVYNVWNAGNGRMIINTNTLPEGIYFVQFLGEGNNILSTKKIAVKH